MQDSSARKSMNVWFASFRRICKQDRRLIAAIAFGLVAIASVAIVGFVLAPSQSAVEITRNAPVESKEQEFDDVGSQDSRGAKKSLYVDVQGAVARSGVYELAEGSRISDALDAAGGLADNADIAGLNRASVLTDGQLVYVPHVGEAGGVQEAASPATAVNQTLTGLISINNATVDQLDELPGVGPSTAQAIVDDRTQNGPFSTLEDLMRVSGIGEKKFEKLKGSITL